MPVTNGEHKLACHAFTHPVLVAHPVLVVDGVEIACE